MTTSAAADLDSAIDEIATRWRAERVERQARRHLDRRDFELLRDAGLLRVPAPQDAGGLWQSPECSARIACEIYRRLASADPSVALVSSMHPSVIAFWLATPDSSQPVWEEQRQAVFASAVAGEQWGTITSEPGSGGDIARTRATATPIDAEPFLPGVAYVVTGEKHFGSGFGIADRMMTTAIPAGESDPTIFVLDVRDRPWDGSAGLILTGEWDGMGMAATQSHAMRLDRAPAVRLAWDGTLDPISRAANQFIWSLFTAVIVGVLDEAIATARQQVAKKADQLRAYEQLEWARADLTTGSPCRRMKVRCVRSKQETRRRRSTPRCAPKKRSRISPRRSCCASRGCWAGGPSHNAPRSRTGSKTSERSDSSAPHGHSPTTPSSPPPSISPTPELPRSRTAPCVVAARFARCSRRPVLGYARVTRCDAAVGARRRIGQPRDASRATPRDG